MATDHEIAEGLFDWINSLRVSEPVKAPEDLSDGAVIWKALQQIDRLSFPGHLPDEVGTDQWVHRWANLKHIYDALSIFLLEECGQRLHLPSGRPDLKAMAQTAPYPDTISLMKLVVVAAVNCSNRIKYLQNMQILAESTQEVLMTTVQEAGEEGGEEVEEEEPDAVASLPSSPPRATPGTDSELAYEERLGKVIADNQRIAHEKRDIQAQLDDLHDRYLKLQSSQEKSLDELKETKERLTDVLAGKGDAGGSRLLDSKQDNLIAALEARALAAEEEADDLRKVNEVLKVRAERVQKLQDDYDEMKVDRDKLSRRANAAEKYKQKLEATQEVEKENNALRSKISDLQSQLKQSDSSKVSSSDLMREVDEYRRLLPSIEQERHELNEMKKRLELDYHALEARHQDTLEQFSRQQKNTEELQGRLRDYEDGVSPATPRTNHADALRALDAFTSTGDFSSHMDEDALTEALQPQEHHSSDDTENDISDAELQAILSAMRAQAEADTTSERSLSQQIERKLFGAIQRSQARNKALQEQLRQQLATGGKPDTSKEEPSTPPARAATSPISFKKDNQALNHQARDEDNDEDDDDTASQLHDALALNDNLQRELRLMTSAWYEQNSRLMMLSGGGGAGGGAMGGGGGGRVGGVRSRAWMGGGGQRKSFLARQRKVVDAVLLGG